MLAWSVGRPSRAGHLGVQEGESVMMRTAVRTGVSCGMLLLALGPVMETAATQERAPTLSAVAYNSDPSFANAGWGATDVGSDRFGNFYAVGTQWWRDNEADPWKNMPCAAKWDADGTLVWKRVYDFGATDYECLSGAVDKDGYFYIGGRKGISVYLLAKCSPDGDVLWWKTRAQNDDGYTGNIAVTSLRIDGDGNVTCVGYAGGGSAVQVVKYDSDGNELWAHCHPLPLEICRDHGRVSGVNSDNDIFIGTNTDGDMSGGEAASIVELAYYDRYLWMAVDGDGPESRRVVLYDVVCRKIVRSLSNPAALDEPVRGLAWDGAAIWVMCGTSSASSLRQLDPMTGELLRSLVTINAEVNGLDWGGGHLWYGDATGHRAACIDPVTGELVESVPVSDGPYEVSYVAPGYLFVTTTSSTLFVEVSTAAILRTLPQWCAPQEGSTWDGDWILWVCDGTNVVYGVEPFSSGSPIREVHRPFALNREDSLVVKLSSATGEVTLSSEIDLGPEEQVVGLDGDAGGNVVAAIWLKGQSRLGVVKLAQDLRVVWTRLVDFPYPGVVPQEIAVGINDRIYVAGRVGGTGTDYFQTDETSHIFTVCLNRDGIEAWRSIFDAGGPSEAEWGDGTTISASLTGEVYTGGGLSYSRTEWNYAMCVLKYEDVGIPTPAVFRVDPIGRVFADGAVLGSQFLTGSADVAEWVQVTGFVEDGDVLELDPTIGQAYRLSQTRCSSLIAGVVSTQPGVTLGAGVVGPQQALLALSGIVPVKITNEGGPIQPGDLLVSSSTPGYAMRWAGSEPCPCALVGKALEPMADERGVINVLLTAH